MNRAGVGSDELAVIALAGIKDVSGTGPPIVRLGVDVDRMLIGPPSALRFFEAASVAILAGLSVLLTRSVVCAELRPVDFAAELVVSIGHVTPPDGNGATAVPQRGEKKSLRRIEIRLGAAESASCVRSSTNCSDAATA
jgi:hypothetical protein